MSGRGLRSPLAVRGRGCPLTTALPPRPLGLGWSARLSSLPYPCRRVSAVSLLSTTHLLRGPFLSPPHTLLLHPNPDRQPVCENDRTDGRQAEAAQRYMRFCPALPQPELFLTAAQRLGCKCTPSFHWAGPRSPTLHTARTPRARARVRAVQGPPDRPAGDWLEPQRCQEGANLGCSHRWPATANG